MSLKYSYWSIWFFILFGEHMLKGFTIESRLVQLNSCTLIKYQMISYQCTVCGGATTIWTGSLFDCISNAINLRHSGFENRSATGSSGECNNGAVTAHSVGVLNTNTIDCYISQLHISMNTSIDNKTIACLSIDGASETVVNTTTVSFITVAVGSPHHIRVTDVNAKHVSFSWNESLLQPQQSFSDSDSVVYNIIASNCGTCPNSTSSLSATCTDLVAYGSICSFSLLAVICDNIFSPITTPLTIVLQVLDAPVVDAKHVILSPSLSLIYSVFNESNPINISNEIDGSALSYFISYYDATSNILCGSVVIQPSSNYCIDSLCRHVFDVSLSLCLSGNNFTLTVVATNVFGDGPVADYSVSVVEANPANCLMGEHLLLIGIASLSSLLLLALVLCIVCFIVTVFSIRSKQKAQRENQQIQTDAHAAGDVITYEEVELNQQLPSTVITTEENIAYAKVSRN